MFENERNRAKALNSAIASGQTVSGNYSGSSFKILCLLGFAKDWKLTTDEAQKAFDGWFTEFPEVKRWQEQTTTTGNQTGITKTLLGRYDSPMNSDPAFANLPLF